MEIFCQECGAANPATSGTCANCAVILRPQNAQLLSPLEIPSYGTGTAAGAAPGAKGGDILDFGFTSPADVNLADAANTDLWPDEAVFVAALDPEIEEPAQSAGMPPSLFEDDQADDVFEQSLSGFRVEDLAETESRLGPNLEPELIAAEPVRKPDEALPSGPEAASVVFDRSEAVEVPAPAPIAPIASAPKREEQSSSRSWKRSLVLYAGIVLSASVLFAAGVGTGRWMGEKPADSLQPVFVPIARKEPAVPPTPEGMAFVAGGEFRMGSDDGDPLSRPAHVVTVQPFYIDLTEVTNESYMKFVETTGHQPPANWQNGTFREEESKLPVTGVTWYDAAEYAAWMGKRLPTEAEWEFAARGSDGRTYPWGNTWDPNFANVGGTSKGIRPVGIGERSPFGVSDMAGNVWEWTASDARPYPGGKDVPWSRLRLKVIRGGNWQSNSTAASSFFRGYYGADGEKNYSSTGFRCVKNKAE